MRIRTWHLSCVCLVVHFIAGVLTPDIGRADILFKTRMDFATSYRSRSVAIDDLDGDGVPDLVTANAYSDDVSVLLGNGDGTFGAAVNYLVGDNPVSVAIDDLDGDGVPDLVVANRDSDSVSMLQGNGDGTFGVTLTYDIGDQPSSVAVSDLDGDGVPDLAVAILGVDSVTVGLGNGNGTFRAAGSFGVGNDPRSVAIDDLDGDGVPDLAVAIKDKANVSVLLGNGDGTFQTTVNYGAGNGPVSVAIDDLDGDGHRDLVVANYDGDNVSVLINMIGEGIISAELTCIPALGTVPFMVSVTVGLNNEFDRQTRRIAGHIDIQLAGGEWFPNWRAGFTNVGAGQTYSFSWMQTIPDLGSVVGNNQFILVAEDVTSSPYNQPPYPPAGDTATAACTVTGIAP